MTHPDQARLRAALNRYGAARSAASTDAAASDEVLAARRALVELLEDAGWEPPPAVLRSLRDGTARGAQRRSA